MLQNTVLKKPKRARAFLFINLLGAITANGFQPCAVHQLTKKYIMKRPKRTDEKYWIGTRNFDHIQFETDLQDYADEVEDALRKAAVRQSLPLSELGDFVDWIRDVKFKKYREGWCQEGGQNGWHCSTDELMKMFKERGNVA